MKQALKFILLLVHYVVVAVTTYYIGDIMSRDTTGVGILPNGIVLLALIVSLISHTKQFILSLKNKHTSL